MYGGIGCVTSLLFLWYCIRACSVAQRLSFVPHDRNFEQSAPITVQLWLHDDSMSISAFLFASFINLMPASRLDCVRAADAITPGRSTVGYLSNWLQYVPTCTVHNWNVESALPSHRTSSLWDWLGGDQANLQQCGFSKQGMAARLSTQLHAVRVSV